MAQHKHGLRFVDDEGRCLACALSVATRALAEAEAEVERLREISGRLINAGRENWDKHKTGSADPHLNRWLGLTGREYRAWFDKQPPFASPPGEETAASDEAEASPFGSLGLEPGDSPHD